MKKRTYGTGSFRKRYEGKYQLRYLGETKWVDAPNDRAADRELRKWVDELDEEKQNGPEVSVNQLLDLHLADLRRNRRKTTDDVERKINKHLRPHLGKKDATKLTAIDIDRYVDFRIEAGEGDTAYATINRMLAALRRSLNIGVQKGLLKTLPPVVQKLPENDPRQGFIEEDTYRAVLMALPAYAQMPWVFSYFTGIRKGELLNILWAWVDWNTSIITVPEAFTKNGKQHQIPLYADMVPFVKLAYQTREPKCPYLFQRDGKQLSVNMFRTAFENTRGELGLLTLIFHDLRRTAVRNMERAGIPRSQAMKVSGHLTESIYTRYAIGNEKDVVEVGKRMATFHETEREKLGQNELWPKLWPTESDGGKGEGAGLASKLKN